MKLSMRSWVRDATIAEEGRTDKDWIIIPLSLVR
jgi:hypothetical protein